MLAGPRGRHCGLRAQKKPLTLPLRGCGLPVQSCTVPATTPIGLLRRRRGPASVVYGMAPFPHPNRHHPRLSRPTPAPLPRQPTLHPVSRKLFGPPAAAWFLPAGPSPCPAGPPRSPGPARGRRRYVGGPARTACPAARAPGLAPGPPPALVRRACGPVPAACCPRSGVVRLHGPPIDNHISYRQTSATKCKKPTRWSILERGDSCPVYNRCNVAHASIPIHYREHYK